MSSRMRMVYPYPGKRRPQNVDEVTFKKSKELKLRDYVREQPNLKVTPCLYEMSLIFTCLKENTFNEKMCTDEIAKFNSCYTRAIEEQHAITERRKNPTKSNVSNKLLDIEINHMIKKYKLK